MGIKFIKQESVDQINSNVDELFKQVICGNKSLETYLDKDQVVFESNIPAEEFSLDTSESNAVLTDLENVKRVYKAMKGLSNSQASDERIWLAYSLSVCKDYMMYRWPAHDVNTINNRWLFGYAAKRSLFRHGIARLWWIGRCTYDEGRPDPFELTSYVLTKQDIINQLLDIGFNGNKVLVLAIIQAIKDAENEGKAVSRENIRSVSRYINALGSMYIVDSLSHDEIYNKVKDLFL